MRHSDDLTVSRFWREYGGTAYPLGSEIDLTAPTGANGRYCRQIVMLEDGALHVRAADGSVGTITATIPAGVTLNLECRAILSTQTAKILVVW